MCDQCEILYINGVKCHETGCHDAWKDYERSCKWCGQSFMPKEKNQVCCDHSCYICYTNVECNCEKCSKWQGSIMHEFYPRDDWKEMCTECGKELEADNHC